MAIKWAVADGNWTATATWNDGTIPQVGDVVYCNGHAILIDTNLNIGNGTIRNDANVENNISAGGYVRINAVRTIYCNLYAKGSKVLQIETASANSHTINGNIEGESCDYIVYFTNMNNKLNVTGDISVVDGNVFWCSNGQGTCVFNGNITIDNGAFWCANGGNIVYAGGTGIITINGDINATNGSVLFKDGYLSSANSSIVVNGNVNCGLFGNLYFSNISIVGNVALGNVKFVNNYITTLSIVGDIEQGSSEICSYINTFNLNGTLNLSGIKPFDYGVQTLNVASGSSITYDNHFYYCYNEINAIDADFDIVCRNQNLDNLSVINNNNLADTYPDEDKVANGVEYGYSGEYEGTMELIDESVVLAGYHYGNKTGTFAVQVPSALTTKLTEVLNKINETYTRLGNMQTLQNTINDAIAELPSEQFIVETIGG